MTIFLSHAPADLPIAESLEKYLERRGQFVELDDGEQAMRPLQSGDALALILSKDFVFSPYRMRLEQRALDAWAEGRLVLIKLDHTIAPVGLRDLPAIDASFEAQRNPFTWQTAAQEIAEKIRRRADAGAPGGSGAAPQTPPQVQPFPRSRTAPARKRSHRKGGGVFAFLLFVIALTACGYAGWALFAGGPRAPIDAVARQLGLPDTEPLLWAIGAIPLAVFLLVLIASTLGGRKHSTAPAVRAPAPAPMSEAGGEAAQPSPDADEEVVREQTTEGAPEGVFVSYARINAPIVMPVCDEVKKAGKKVWMDRDSIHAGEGWAGEIVRAIRGSSNVMVMCSNAAFESDHVKREIYLADRYRKRLLPVFVEDAKPPEDFEYFFAGVQWLKLYETPESERPAAVLRLLGA